MQRINNRGPRCEPWSTPKVVPKKLRLMPIYCLWLLVSIWNIRTNLSTKDTMYSIPNLASLLERILWSTLSKALQSVRFVWTELFFNIILKSYCCWMTNYCVIIWILVFNFLLLGFFPFGIGIIINFIQTDGNCPASIDLLNSTESRKNMFL